MEIELPFWRAVDAGIPVSELDKWSLEDLDKYMAFLDWKSDCERAVTKCIRQKDEK